MATGGALVDLYAVLGVARGASQQEVSKAYRKLALRNHPDKVAPAARALAAERFREIARAYEVLRDGRKRRCYDETGIYDGHMGAGGPSEYDVFFKNFFGDEARGSDGRSADYTYYSLANYDRLTLKEEDLPPYMHDIVKVGLNYLAKAVHDLEDREVVFLRHQRVDILYVMVAYFEPLTQTSFDDGYIIHYYDNPLQAGIAPAWSDQNVLGGGKRLSAEVRGQRGLSDAQFARRQDLARAALCAPDPQAALEEKYAEIVAREAAARRREGGSSVEVAEAPVAIDAPAPGGGGAEAPPEAPAAGPAALGAAGRGAADKAFDDACCLPLQFFWAPWHAERPRVAVLAA